MRSEIDFLAAVDLAVFFAAVVAFVAFVIYVNCEPTFTGFERTVLIETAIIGLVLIGIK